MAMTQAARHIKKAPGPFVPGPFLPFYTLFFTVSER
jgi:hypothetical protein